jgi:hypothetical protein
MLASVQTAMPVCLPVPNNLDHRLDITISVKAVAGDARNSPAAIPRLTRPEVIQ